MNKFRIIVFLIILWQVLPSGSGAQVKTLDPVAFPEHFQIHKLMTEKGFSVRFMDNAYQDQYGFLWIGTQYGTHMFDGYNISDVMVRESDSTYSMLEDVRAFRDDKDGGVWLCGSPRGLCYYDRLTNIMTVPRRFTDFRSPIKNRVYGIFQDRTGLYWVFTESGLFLWDRETDSVFQTEVEFTFLWHLKGGRDDFKLLETDDGSVWIPSATNGLFRYLPETGEFLIYRHDPSDPGSISSDNVTDIVEDSRGRLWVSTFGGGFNILSDAEQGIFEHIRHDPGNINTIPSDIIMDLMVDRSGNIWMAGQGFAKYQASTEKFLSYKIELEPYFLYQIINLNDFYKIVEDPDGHIWLRTHWYGGVFLFDPELERIYSLNDNHGQFPAENTRVFDVFIDPGGMIWVVTADGTAIIEKKPLKQFHLLGNELKIAGSVYQFNVNRIFSDSQGTLWTGIGEGMVIKCTDAGMDLPFESSQCQILEIGVELHSIVEIDSENLYMFADNRLHRFNRNSERLSLLPFDTTIDSILGKARVMEVYRDNNGYIWIGTYTDGIVVYDPASGQQAYHEYDYDDLEGIPPGQLAFREDDKGNLWMGAFGRGISILNKSQVDEIFTSDKLSVNRYSKYKGQSRGLSSDEILVTHFDSRNRMWIGTASGLNLYSPQDNAYAAFWKMITGICG
jgi:ligand-binding sensor domain-containing protein